MSRKQRHITEPLAIPIEDRMKPVVLHDWHFFEEKENLYNLMVKFAKFTACLPYTHRKNPMEFKGSLPDEAI